MIYDFELFILGIILKLRKMNSWHGFPQVNDESAAGIMIVNKVIAVNQDKYFISKFIGYCL